VKRQFQWPSGVMCSYLHDWEGKVAHWPSDSKQAPIAAAQAHAQLRAHEF